MIAVFYGADVFRSREAFRSARMEAEEHSGGPAVVLRDRALTPVSFQTAVEGQTLFGASPPLAVERLTAFSGEQGAAVARLLHGFHPLLVLPDHSRGPGFHPLLVLPDHSRGPGSPDTRVILVWEEGVPHAQGVVWKALKKVAAKLEVFSPLSETQAGSWIQQRLQETGGTIQPAAVARLVEREGTDLGRLSSELEKLVLLKNGEPITAADVDELSPGRALAPVFATVQAITRGDAQVALRLLCEARKAGEEPRRLFFLLIRELRNLLQVRDGLDRGESPTAWSIAGTLRLPRSAAESLLEAALRTTTPNIRALFDRCVVSYYALNVGRAEAEEVLETLIVRPLEGTGE